MGDSGRINVDKPLWDQQNYIGRWKHFAFISDSRTILEPDEKFCKAKKLCDGYKIGREPPGTRREDIIYAKKLKDSAFHPDNGELMHFIGRMSFQLPGSLLLTAAMTTFCKTAAAVVSCQVVNQAFNAFVNYTNRNAMSDDPEDKIIVQQAFLCATLASCAAAVGFRRMLACRGPAIARLVPFYAVTAGNMVNLPIMRQREIIRGIPIYATDSEEKCIMRSRIAAVKGISECVISRIAMTAPGLIMIPIVLHRIRPYCFYQLRPWIAYPIVLFISTACLLVSIPSGLAIFPQTNSMRSEFMKIRSSEYEEFAEIYKDKQCPEMVYYNKGL